MSTEVTKQENQAPAHARRQEFVRPHYEVSGDEQAFQVRVSLPGVSKDQAKITLEGDSLTVEANRNTHWQEGWRPVYREIPRADYRLRLQLNVRVNEEKIEASTRDGVLTISLPVADEAKPRTIQVQ